jgi:hypothetical protein
MNKSKRLLLWSEIRVFVIVSILLSVAEILPPMLFAYLAGNFQLFWVSAVIWIASIQVGYISFSSYNTLKKQFKAVDNIAQVIKDALDVVNTEESIDIEMNDVRPN